MAASLETLERLASAHAGAPSRAQRMLVIVNPYATTVSDRLKNLVVYALRGRYDVDALDTGGRGHATALAREAADEGYDVVVAFGGDGTVNEAANGLAGSATPLTCLPGGATNVYCRILGIPDEIVDATEHMLRLADNWRPFRVDLGMVNDRGFAFSAGLGLDASVVERVDAHPHLKSRLNEYYFTWAAISTFTRRYVVHPPRLLVEADGVELEGVTAVVQNGAPYTYFRRRPIEIADGARLDGGRLSGAVLVRANPLDMPTVLWRAFSGRARLSRHRRVRSFDAERLTVSSTDDRPLPLQVDGDFITDVHRAEFSVRPGGLLVVS